MQIEALFISNEATLKDALEQLDKTAHGVLFLVNKQHQFQRTITDGDLRRYVLEKRSLDINLKSLSDIKSICVEQYLPAEEALRVMDQYDVNHLPVIDAKRIPRAILRRKELSLKVALSQPHMGEEEQGYISEAFDSNWIAPTGPNVDAFEQKLAEHVGCNAAAAVSSGTAAIHLGLILLDVKAGDTVFCSSLTFVASANPILYQSATPVFIDSEADTWNMCPDALAIALKEAAKRNKLPKAVIVVSLYGQPAKMDMLKPICDQYDIPILEDAAESLGASYQDKHSGTAGKLGVYSFNGNKIITTSGGGMLVSDDIQMIEKARYFATQAKVPAPHYQHEDIGYNYRMSNILAGVGLGQLTLLAKRVEQRRNIFNNYSKALQNIECIQWMPEHANSYATRWLSVLTLDPKQTNITPQSLCERLAKFGIEARRSWKPMHQQPLFEDCMFYQSKDGRPFSDWTFDHGVCLPSSSNMTEEQQRHVINALGDILNEL